MVSCSTDVQKTRQQGLIVQFSAYKGTARTQGLHVQNLDYTYVV
jgi:hypothetical protein